MSICLVCLVKLLNNFILSFFVILIVKFFVSIIMFFGCFFKGGMVIMLKVKWLRRLVWNLFVLVNVGRFLLVVVIKWILVFIVLLLLICLNLLYFIMWSSFFWINLDVFVSLFKNKVLLWVSLKCFLWCFVVLVNVFVL